MVYQAEKLLEIALEETGYCEKRSLSRLEDKTANAGSGNFTKYARDLYGAGYYNGNKQGVPWCSVFVDWCHYMASDKDKYTAQAVSCQSGPYGASCTYSMGYYKACGRFHTRDPQAGDQIYFGSGSSAEHTGIVYRVDAENVYTVEGNTSGESGVVSNGGGVFCKVYPKDDKKILGYGRPKFSQTEKKLPTLRRGDRGETVRALQLLLEGNACKCGKWGADGQFGAATESALQQYQKKKRLPQTGVAGPELWNSLLGIS